MLRLRGVLGQLRRETEPLTTTASTIQALHPAPLPARWRRGFAVAASIALLVVAGRFLPKSQETEVPKTRTATLTAANDDPRLGLSLRGESATTLLAIASPTNDPNVQVFFLYPRLDAVATSEPRTRSSND